MTSTPSLQDPARVLLGRIADQAVLDAVDAALAAGTADWRIDPFNSGDVIGLVATDGGTLDRALLVVYMLDEDFEVSDEFMESVR